MSENPSNLIEGAFWGSSSKKEHPLHHVCPYFGSFPPQLPKFFLDKLPSQTVLDPFAGRGTVLLEAALKGKTVYGVDISPVALALSQVKIQCAPRMQVLNEIDALNLKGDAPEPPVEIAPFYHPETWRQVYNLQQASLSPTLKALVLGRLHGHSPGFFSVKTFNVISVTSGSLQTATEKHGVGDVYAKDIRQLLVKAANKFIPFEGISAKGEIFRTDARSIPLPDGSVDLIVTSPPFLDVIDYAQVNWLRLWFLNESEPPETFIKSETAYKDFLRGVLTELSRVLTPDGTIVFEVGPIQRNPLLYTEVLEASQGILKTEVVIRHVFADEDVSKISRAMHGGQKTTTMSNDCVILRHLNSAKLDVEWSTLPVDSGTVTLEDLFGVS